jgi:hypothetical protein
MAGKGALEAFFGVRADFFPRAEFRRFLFFPARDFFVGLAFVFAEVPILRSISVLL